MFADCYRKRRVLVTGHSGFMGSWLALWLQTLGAKVCAVGMRPNYSPNHFELLQLSVQTEWMKIREGAELRSVIMEFEPEVIFHLAAQPLRDVALVEPVETCTTNVMGTLYLLEAVRQIGTVRAVVTGTDAGCYAEQLPTESAREHDPLGGYNLCGATKAAAELVAAGYRASFFPPDRYGIDHRTLIAGTRSGAAIGGGDWISGRLIPDLMRAASIGHEAEFPADAPNVAWQHVLEPLSGFLSLGQRLLAGERECAASWNFAPGDNAPQLTFEESAQVLKSVWPTVKYRVGQANPRRPLPCLRRLDSNRARAQLNWRPVWSVTRTLERTGRWYRDFYENNRVNSEADLAAYTADAAALGLPWAIQ